MLHHKTHRFYVGSCLNHHKCIILASRPTYVSGVTYIILSTGPIADYCVIDVTVTHTAACIHNNHRAEMNAIPCCFTTIPRDDVRQSSSRCLVCAGLKKTTYFTSVVVLPSS